jgi:Fe2+ or Zn2+ uptake regulation protein
MRASKAGGAQRQGGSMQVYKTVNPREQHITEADSQSARSPRRPKGAVRSAILSLLEEERKPLAYSRIVHTMERRIGASDKNVYHNLDLLAKEGTIHVESDKGRKTALLVNSQRAPAPAPGAPPPPTPASPPRIYSTAQETARRSILSLLAEDPNGYSYPRIVSILESRLDMARSTVYVVLDRMSAGREIDVDTINNRKHAKLPAQPSAAPAPPPPEERLAAYQYPTQQDRIAIDYSTDLHIPGAALAPAAEPPALPYVPHFIDCSLKIAGLDITARVTLDMPNSIAREATFRYLVKLIAQIERVGGELLNVAQLSSDRDAAMLMAEEEQRKRQELEERIAQIDRALHPPPDPEA